MFRRYAIFHTPPPGRLADFGAAWLGWDAAAGRSASHPAVAGLPRPVAEITATPRRYGFHATMKPPFAVAQGTTPEELGRAFADFCARHGPVATDGLTLTDAGGFVALTPLGDTAALDALAAAVVRDLDAFRAPPAPEALARRRAAGLDPVQERMLQRWGYPYVVEAFRFHMTLSGPVTPAEAEQIRAALGPLLAGLVPAPYPIDALSLLGEDAAGRFHLVARRSLSG